jgi:hypothetical protein
MPACASSTGGTVPWPRSARSRRVYRRNPKLSMSPPPPPLGMSASHIAHVLDGCAEAGRTHHRAVGAGKAPSGNLLPARMLEILKQEVPDSGGVHSPGLLTRRRLHGRGGRAALFLRGRLMLDCGKYLNCRGRCQPPPETNGRPRSTRARCPCPATPKCRDIPGPRLIRR